MMLSDTVPSQSVPGPAHDSPLNPPLSTSSDAPLRPYGGGWQAELSFTVSARALAQGGMRSVLTDNRHHGPLRLQKPLWPEGHQPVHLLLLHPPGGLAGGDQLQIQACIERNAQCLVTTPGAGKFYRSDVRSQMSVRLRVEAGAALEWLPQETIIQDGADAGSQMHVELGGDARMMASEVTVFGRKAFGERFTCGRFDQHLSIRRDGQLLFEDRSLWRPEVLTEPTVLGHHHVNAMLWACRQEAWSEDEVAALEASLDARQVLAGVSQVRPGLLLARVVGSEVEPVRGALHQAWAMLRPQLLQRSAQLPRIWNT